MRQQYLLTGLLLAGASLLPAASLPAAKQACSAGKPTAQSYKWNFQSEAVQLLDRVRTDVLDAKKHAAILQTKTEDPSMDWRFDADELTTIRDDINDMGHAMCRLKAIRRVTSPQEKRVIDRTLPLAQSLAANADAAIVHLNRNQMDYWQPLYRTYATNMYTDAQKISGAIGHFEKHVKS